MSEKTVSIHVPAKKSGTPQGEHVDEGLARWGRAELGNALIDYGLDLVYSRGSAAFDLDHNQATVLRPHIEQDESGMYVVRVRPEVIAATGLSAIRNVSKALSTDQVTLPELNHPHVRATARDKGTSNKLFGSYAKRSVLLDTIADLGSIEALAGDELVVKPRNGMKSENVHMINRRDMATFLATERETPLRWIAEEKIDFSAPIPVKGLTPTDQEMIDYANKQGLPKELRAYTYGRDNDGNLITSYVLRTVNTGETRFGNDFWVYVEENSIPAEVAQGTDTVYESFSQHTGVSEMHLGIDWVYAIEPSSGDPRWMIMEANGSEPQLVYESENPTVARDQTQKLAAQLHRIATKH